MYLQVIRREGCNGDQDKSQVEDAEQDPTQFRLVDDPPGQGGLAIRLVLQDKPREVARHRHPKVALHPDLVVRWRPLHSAATALLRPNGS